jgi:hypothetical protein
MKSVGTCPRCGGNSLAEWLDGDSSCWTCGFVLYRKALTPVATNPRYVPRTHVHKVPAHPR